MSKLFRTWPQWLFLCVQFFKCIFQFSIILPKSGANWLSTSRDSSFFSIFQMFSILYYCCTYYGKAVVVPDPSFCHIKAIFANYWHWQPLRFGCSTVLPNADWPNADWPNADSQNAVSLNAILQIAVLLNAILQIAVSPNAISPNAVLPDANLPISIMPIRRMSFKWMLIRRMLIHWMQIPQIPFRRMLFWWMPFHQRRVRWMLIHQCDTPNSTLPNIVLSNANSQNAIFASNF